MITCHLGNGCSVSAIDHGVAVDTSMGMTPLDGLMMGTRCGSIDPAIVPFLMEHEGMTPSEVENLMNKKSGLLGITGVSNDLRSVREEAEKGNERAMLAYEMYSNSVKKYIGQYIAVMGGVDAIVLAERRRRKRPEDASHDLRPALQTMGIILDLKASSAKQRGEPRDFIFPF